MFLNNQMNQNTTFSKTKNPLYLCNTIKKNDDSMSKSTSSVATHTKPTNSEFLDT